MELSPKIQEIVDNLRKLLGGEEFRFFESSVQKEIAKPPKVAIIGKTGVGKSTTINALFGLQEKVSHTTHGTTEASKKIIELPQGGKLEVIDMPGLGEDIELDKEYTEIYQRTLPEADVVLYVIQGNLKALTEDEKILRDIVQNVMGNLKGRLVVGLNQVDKIGPGTWNTRFNFPSPEQEDNINRRCQYIQEKLSSALSIEVEQVEYYSAEKRYRLYNLLTAIIKASGNVGWKFTINPADPIALADPSLQDFLRQQLKG
ncbi:50S ribosome-binding GTPase [Anabaenopsis tanganyikae CS-531]|uniref:50S ribosome-binding GTPase n=1 Tax=Anabaenopsis tanganyikae CS-531 TaxID=2785304 RepID=A0ABT6KIG2_9CYAN|nr:GTPase [Anabaenopsis tanganyikae]MDH6107700.1 50S ribosome-binding GTPase [Anabaenopsis tanganyikae CS-531]